MKSKIIVISDEALAAAAYEISAVDYPNYEPDLERARTVLLAALPHLNLVTPCCGEGEGCTAERCTGYPACDGPSD